MTIEFGKKNLSCFGALNPLDAFASTSASLSIDSNNDVVFICIKAANNYAMMVYPKNYAGNIVSCSDYTKVLPIEATLSFGYTPCIEDFE